MFTSFFESIICVDSIGLEVEVWVGRKWFSRLLPKRRIEVLMKAAAAKGMKELHHYYVK